MAKRLMVLLGMLALALATAVPAFAESEPQLTGVIERPKDDNYMYSTHAMTDETSGDYYALDSDVMDLDAYRGQRVTVFGALPPGYDNGQDDDGPPLFKVTHVERADGPDNGKGGTTTGDDGGSAPVLSGDTSNADRGGSGVATGPPAPSGKGQLPATGGLTVAGAIGAVLIGGGLIARRITR